MVVKTFSAQVIRGQLQFQESLDEFEGQQVDVQITTVAAENVSSHESMSDPESIEPPEWLNVERDVYVKMPLKSEILKDVVVKDGGRMRPCIILPEELPND